MAKPTKAEVKKWYQLGFNDELNGTDTEDSEHYILNAAYTRGVMDAWAGDDVSSVDRKPISEIVNEIMDQFS